MLAMAEVGRRAPGDWMVHEVDERRWYAVYTKARAEWLVHKGLREQGYETLYLHRRATVSHARRKIGVLRPYFPRYVFVAVGPRQSVYAVNTTIGVSTVVYAGLDPLEIPAEVIAELRARGDENGLVEERGPEARKRLKRGQQVRIAGGPFEGLLALVALDSGNAIRVWLDGFGGKVEAILDPSGLEPVSPEWRS